MHVNQPERWETCEIYFKQFVRKGSWFGWMNLQFYALALGPNGEYTAAQSVECKCKTTVGVRLNNVPIRNSDNMTAFNGLVTQLVNAGWEPVDSRGEEWYNYRFRRRIQ
jgi:hypothetical protein